MKRPPLNEIPLSMALEEIQRPGSGTVTMNAGQWDALLERLYNEDFILLELDHKERPRRAYRRLESKKEWKQ